MALEPVGPDTDVDISNVSDIKFCIFLVVVIVGVWEAEALDSGVLDEPVAVFGAINIYGWEGVSQAARGKFVCFYKRFVDHESFGAAIQEDSRIDFSARELSHKGTSEHDRRRKYISRHRSGYMLRVNGF